VAIVLLALLPSVADGASVANNVVVFPAETRVFVGIGTKDEVLPVAFPDAVVPFPLFCRTIRESSSGSHRGQGQAVVNVERNRNMIEYKWRFDEVRIVEIRVLTPLQSSIFQPIHQKIFPISRICKYTCAKSSEEYFQCFV